jgi:hypothetical protein
MYFLERPLKEALAFKGRNSSLELRPLNANNLSLVLTKRKL